MGEAMITRKGASGKDYIEGSMTITDTNTMLLAFDAEVVDGDSYSVLVQGRFGDSLKAFTISGQITYNDANGKFTAGYILTTQFYTATVTAYMVGRRTSVTKSGNHHEIIFDLDIVDNSDTYRTSFTASTKMEINMCRLYKVE